MKKYYTTWEREREREKQKLIILEVERCCNASSKKKKLRGGWKNTSINQLAQEINNNDDGEVSELEFWKMKSRSLNDGETVLEES